MTGKQRRRWTCNQSLVRLRLDKWNAGRLTQWQTLAKVRHSEVKFPVDAGLYLGYGPVTLPRGSKQPALKANAAIQSGESSELRIAFPSEQAALLDRTFALMADYGTLGGRSRNGWGSFILEDDLPAAGPPLRAWLDCLDRDWPHAIGEDGSEPLIWQTGTFDDWKQLMHRLAEIKIGLRTQFGFHGGNNTQHPEKRHWLSYPVTQS